MKVIAVATQKGGVGKTTTAAHIAVEAERDGVRVLIVDLDEQGTATKWYQRREAEAPQLVQVKTAELQVALDAAKAGGFGLVILDTAGKADPGTAAAMRTADLTLLPCSPSPLDVEAQIETVQTLTRLGKSFAFLISKAPPRRGVTKLSARALDATRGLSMLGTVVQSVIVNRAVYQDSMGAGMTATEYEPNGPAADETRRAWEQIRKIAGVSVFVQA
jgi:chromosome partitioning protein